MQPAGQARGEGGPPGGWHPEAGTPRHGTRGARQRRGGEGARLRTPFDAQVHAAGSRPAAVGSHRVWAVVCLFEVVSFALVSVWRL